jgi:hypothetical protein
MVAFIATWFILLAIRLLRGPSASLRAHAPDSGTDAP